jgi:predicted membrane-bound spermidine synthase
LSFILIIMQMRATLKNYRYESIALLTGAAVMILEIVGARLIAPYFGTSTYVWTAMIGVILASLALGYAVGGRFADNDNTKDMLGKILFVAAILVIICGYTQASLLEGIAEWGLDVRLGALLAALLLFGVPSMLIGMVSPHLAKIRVVSLDTTGSTIGRLEAAGALGSIAGTFLAGYFLLGLFGSRTLVFGIALLLVATSFLAGTTFWLRSRLIVAAIALLLIPVANLKASHVLADVDSSYARYRVEATQFGYYDARLLTTDRSGIQSAVAVEMPYVPIFSYVQQFYRAVQANPDARRLLVIGGGTYTFPSTVVKTLDNKAVDVVEIDPALDELANKFFFLAHSANLNIIHADGRTYLNENKKQYDMIFMDAFASISPPFQLTSKEVIAHMQNSISPQGVIVVNLISDYGNGNDEYLRAVKTTYESVFKYVAIYQSDTTRSLDDRQNFILLATDDGESLIRHQEFIGQKPLGFKSGGIVLTDNYAPIERLTF